MSETLSVDTMTYSPNLGHASKNVYQCIAAVSAAMAKVGISKGRKNQQQGYAFRGIDDVYNVLAPMLAEHGLVVLPRFLRRECVERTTKNGAAQFFVVVEAEFDFVSTADRSTHTARTFGEAQDTGDKATNKAMSAAYKYAAFQTFCIPTEGDNDADAHTPEPSVPRAPDGFDAWVAELQTTAMEGLAQLQAVWKASAEPLRRYMTTYHADKWAAIKAVAEQAKPAAA